MDGLDVILGLQGGQGGEHDVAVAGAVLLVHLADTCREGARKRSGLRPRDAGWVCLKAGGGALEDQAVSAIRLEALFTATYKIGHHVSAISLGVDSSLLSLRLTAPFCPWVPSSTTGGAPNNEICDSSIRLGSHV